MGSYCCKDTRQETDRRVVSEASSDNYSSFYKSKKLATIMEEAHDGSEISKNSSTNIRRFIHSDN